MNTQGLKRKNLAIHIRRRKGMKRLALSVGSDGRVSLTAPRATPLWYIERFLEEKMVWIEKTLLRLGITRPERIGEYGEQEKIRYAALKGKAEALIHERLLHLNRHYQFSYTRVTVRNQRSRWGSCSATGKLSFNYRLILLPPHLVDYVIIHELCHLRELNHSRAFWALVAEMSPEYRAHRRELRRMNILSPALRTTGRESV